MDQIVRLSDVLEFHDSTVRSVETQGSSVIVEFEPAITHRTCGGPGVDDGDVLLQRVRLIFLEARVTGSITACNGELWKGAIYLPSNTLSLMPVPHLHCGSVRAELVFVNGEVLNIEGKGFDCSTQGKATFIQRYIA